MGKEAIGRMNSAKACVAEKPFVSRGAEYPGPSCDIEAQIHDTPGALDRMVFGGEDFRRPFGAVVHAIGPIFCNPIQMRPDRFKLDYHLRDRMLNFGMIGHRSRKG